MLMCSILYDANLKCKCKISLLVKEIRCNNASLNAIFTNTNFKTLGWKTMKNLMQCSCNLFLGIKCTWNWK